MGFLIQYQCRVSHVVLFHLLGLHRKLCYFVLFDGSWRCYDFHPQRSFNLSPTIWVLCPIPTQYSVMGFLIRYGYQIFQERMKRFGAEHFSSRSRTCLRPQGKSESCRGASATVGAHSHSQTNSWAFG